jgi:hypothetical protein
MRSIRLGRTFSPLIPLSLAGEPPEVRRQLAQVYRSMKLLGSAPRRMASVSRRIGYPTAEAVRNALEKMDSDMLGPHPIYRLEG